MNVIRDQFTSRRQNKGTAFEVENSSTMRRNSIAPRSVNFRIRNQGIVPASHQPWQSFTRTPAQPSASLSTSRCSSGTRAAGSSVLSSAVQNSAIRSSMTSCGSRPHQTPRTPRTPRSAASAETETNCIVALAEGRGQARGEVGLAAIDIKRPNLFLCQLSDSQTYTNTLAKINVFNPVEVLLPNTLCEGTQPNKLVECIREQYPQLTITTVQRRHFNDANGMLLIQKLCAPQYSGVQVLVSQRFYSLAATAALLKYVEFIQNMVFAPRSLRIQYQGSNNTMLIDVDTAQRLELVRGASGNANSMSLLGTLSMCRTVGGSRLLRASLLQPPCLPEVIEDRFDCVQEIVDKPELYHNMQAALARLSDCEQLLALSMAAPTSGSGALRHTENQLNYVLLLKSCLESLPQLAETLKDAKTKHLCELKEKLEDATFEVLREHITKVIHDDAHTERSFSAASLQRCFAVHSGINGLLDVARKTYCELIDEIADIVNKHREETGLPMRVGYNSTRGFHIQLPLSGANSRHRNIDLPPSFIQVHCTRSVTTMTTQKLVHTDQRCKETLTEILSMSNVVISELLSETRQHAGSLYQMCEAVSQLDMMMCLASVSSLPGYVRPTFGSQLNVKASRHPILTFLHHTEPVANDIIASDVENFHIITGPNMGGKSIYLRQVALLQILAQVGCFVPAESASFRICDRIFSRIGFDDSIESNASTFAVEIREMAQVLSSLTPRSLVIVDELCRGTSVEEGTSVAWALCERLLDTKAFTFFATHFLLLTKLQDLYPNVLNHHLQAEEKDIEGQQQAEEGDEGSKWIQYTHRLVPGVTNLERYGLRLAQLSGMPRVITQKASELLQSLAVQRTPIGERTESSGKQCLQTHFSHLCCDVVTAFQEGNTAVEFVELQAKFLEDHPNCLDPPTSSPEVSMKFPSPIISDKQNIQQSCEELSGQQDEFLLEHSDLIVTPSPSHQTMRNRSSASTTSEHLVLIKNNLSSGISKPDVTSYSIQTPVCGKLQEPPVPAMLETSIFSAQSQKSQVTNLQMSSGCLTSMTRPAPTKLQLNPDLQVPQISVTAPDQSQKSPVIANFPQTCSYSPIPLTMLGSAKLQNSPIPKTSEVFPVCIKLELSSSQPQVTPTSPNLQVFSPVNFDCKSLTTPDASVISKGSPVTFNLMTASNDHAQKQISPVTSNCMSSISPAATVKTHASPVASSFMATSPTTKIKMSPATCDVTNAIPAINSHLPCVNSKLIQHAQLQKPTVTFLQSHTDQQASPALVKSLKCLDHENAQLVTPIETHSLFKSPTFSSFKYPQRYVTPVIARKLSESAAIAEEQILPALPSLALQSPVYNSYRAKRARVSGLKPFRPPLRNFIPPTIHQLETIEPASNALSNPNNSQVSPSSSLNDRKSSGINPQRPSFYKLISHAIQKPKAVKAMGISTKNDVSMDDDLNFKLSSSCPVANKKSSLNNSKRLPFRNVIPQRNQQPKKFESMDQSESPSYSPLISQASSLSDNKFSLNISQHSSFCKVTPEKQLQASESTGMPNEPMDDESQKSPSYSPLISQASPSYSPLIDRESPPVSEATPISFNQWLLSHRGTNNTLYD